MDFPMMWWWSGCAWMSRNQPHLRSRLTIRKTRTSPAEPGSREIQKIVSYLSFSNAHRQRNADIAQTIAAFIKSPDKISFQSKPGKEVPLRVLNGSFLRRMTDLLLRLDTTVTLEKSTF